MSVSGQVFRFVFVAAALLGVAISPRSAAADEPERPVYYDSSVYPPPSTRYKLALVGVAVSATWYGAAYGFSALWPDAPGAEDLRIPVAGPWMALGETGCADDDPDCSTFIVVLRAVRPTHPPRALGSGCGQRSPVRYGRKNSPSQPGGASAALATRSS